MADYDAYDEATLQRMANEAESYEERSAIRQALRRKKKDRGENVGRSRARGNSIYNRFAGSTAPTKQAAPKNYVITESEATTSARPPSTGGSASGKGSSRGSSTPTQREATSSPIARPRSPTPPPTPEQPSREEEEKPAATTLEEEGEGEQEVQQGEDEIDVEAAKEEEAPLSPPPSPEQPTEPPQQEQDEEVDGSDRTPAAELPEEVEQEQEQEQEVVEEEEERAASPEKEEEPAIVKEEQPVSHREEVDAGSRRQGREESESTSSGGARFGGVTLRSRRTDSTPSQKSMDEPQNEFLNLRLRQTSRDGSGGRGRKAEAEPKVDFGVKLKSAPREKPPVASPPSHKRADESRGSEQNTPRTLKDYQELSSRSTAKGRSRRERDADIEPPSLEPDELQKYLVAYINSELSLHPPLPVKGGALFETCSNPTNLCKLVNKSVPNTVDLRALTKISGSASEDQRREALKDNMTLALESARAIGCRVNDDTSDNILNRHPQTIRDFLVDLIRAKAVNLPGMDDEPSSTFTNMATLFEKLNISVGGEEETVDVGPAAATEEVSWRDDREKVRKALESPPPKVAEKESWRETTATKPTTSDTTELSYEERAAMRRAQRERKAREAESGGSTELSYEERAAQRRADRERRRREREALAK